jgi:hypothetical protein
MELGNLQKALELYQMALEIELKCFGGAHAGVAATKKNIGIVYHNGHIYAASVSVEPPPSPRQAGKTPSHTFCFSLSSSTLSLSREWMPARIRVSNHRKTGWIEVSMRFSCQPFLGTPRPFRHRRASPTGGDTSRTARCQRQRRRGVRRGALGPRNCVMPGRGAPPIDATRRRRTRETRNYSVSLSTRGSGPSSWSPGSPTRPPAAHQDLQ